MARTLVFLPKSAPCGPAFAGGIVVGIGYETASRRCARISPETPAFTFEFGNTAHSVARRFRVSLDRAAIHARLDLTLLVLHRIFKGQGFAFVEERPAVLALQGAQLPYRRAVHPFLHLEHLVGRFLSERRSEKIGVEISCLDQTSEHRHPAIR